MRYVIALLIAALLLGALYAFHLHMMGLMKQWREANATLSVLQSILVKCAMSMHRYWYIVLVLLFGGALTVAHLTASAPDASSER